MYRRGKQARLLTNGIIGVSTDTTLGDEHWNDVNLLLDGSSLTDDLSTANNDVSQSASAVTLLNTTGPYGTTQDVLDFNGTTDSHLVGAAGDLANLDDGQPWTMECWVKFDASDLQGVFGVSATATGGSGIAVRWNVNQWQWWVDGFGSTASFSRSPDTTNWQHVALVYDGAGSSTLYIDGNSSSTHPRTCVLGANDRSVVGRTYAQTGTEELDGKIADFRVTHGVTRYTADFTPPTASFLTNAPSTTTTGRRGVGTYDTGDEHWDNVTLLLDGSSPTNDLSNTNQDTSITNTGGVSSVSMTGPTGYGTVDALRFNETTNQPYTRYLTTSHYSANLYNQDFTIEGWFNLPSNPYPAPSTNAILFAHLSSITTHSVIAFVDNSNDDIALVVGDGSPTWAVLENTTGVNFTTGWQHIAVTRAGDTYRLFKDGAVIATATSSVTVAVTGDFVLMASTSSGDNPIPGDVFDFRITEGVARYTSNFTLPTESFPTALTGTPEATDTLRTRGYIGATPAGSGGMLTLYDRYIDTLA